VANYQGKVNLSTDTLAGIADIHTNTVPNRKPMKVTYGKTRSYVDVSDAHQPCQKKVTDNE
jgi:hypothetical protein